MRTKTQIELEAEIEKLEKYMSETLLYETYLDGKLDCLKAKLQQHLEDIKQFEELIDKMDRHNVIHVDELKSKLKEI